MEERSLASEEIGHNELKSDQQLSKLSYSLVIPAYNEGERIGPFLKDLVQNLSYFQEIIVVCDGNDNTPLVSKAISDNIVVLKYDRKLGKGGAILEGFNYASGDVIGYVDADGAVPWYEVEKVFNFVTEDNPVVIASRWLRNSKRLEPQSLLRITLGRIYHYLTILILGIYVKDTQCGLKAYSSEVIRRISPKLQLKNLSIDTAFLYHCKRAGFKIKEISIEWRSVNGSKFKPFRTALYMFMTLIGIKIMNSRFGKFFASASYGIVEKINNL